MGETERECVEEFPPRPRKNNFPTFVREGGDTESWTYGGKRKICLQDVSAGNRDIGPISSQKVSLRSEGNELFESTLNIHGKIATKQNLENKIIFEIYKKTEFCKQ